MGVYKMLQIHARITLHPGTLGAVMHAGLQDHGRFWGKGCQGHPTSDVTALGRGRGGDVRKLQ